VIFGFQCDSYSGTWDYGINCQTTSNPKFQWVHSNVPCNCRKWPAKTWMHIQVKYHHDGNGFATYDQVALNGVVSNFVGATHNSAFVLGWEKNVIQTQFQIDGFGASGGNTIYADHINLARW
jgi:hypothetical protein